MLIETYLGWKDFKFYPNRYYFAFPTSEDFKKDAKGTEAYSDHFVFDNEGSRFLLTKYDKNCYNYEE